MLFDEKKFRKCLPAEMLAEKRFVRYFLKAKPEGGTAKIPLGNHSDPTTWSTFDECVKQLENKEQGIGYCFLGGDVHGLDIDHCRNATTGTLCNEAMVLLSRLGSWSEYSVSGQGIHVFFLGQVRGKQLTETCLQYWNPKNSPRFFALTCDVVGEAFTRLKDIGEEFNYIFATARHISAKIREELKTIDPEQWAALPTERQVTEVVEREKAKTKTRKVCKDFDIKDFLAFYSIGIDNECDNQLGHCVRLQTCPIKGEPHVGQNSTTTNIIYPTADNGLAFHCNSTGCVDYGIADVIKRLAEDGTPYPKRIYEASARNDQRIQRVPDESHRGSRLESGANKSKKHKVWLWPGYIQQNQLHHFAGASSEGKSPVTRDLIGRITSGENWPDGSTNIHGPQSVILLASEDDWSDTIVPGLELAGANTELVFEFISTLSRGEEVVDVTTALDRDIDEIAAHIKSRDDVGLVVIDPITNYLGNKSMNKEDEMRSILMPLSKMAQSFNVSVVTVGHFNKRDKDTALFQRLMGAAAFGGVARQVLIFGDDPNTEDKFSHVMGLLRHNNYPALKYRTIAKPMEWDGKTSDIVGVDWCGPAENVDLDEVVTRRKQSDKGKDAEAAAFIKAMLRDGAKATKIIEDALKDASIECSNISRAAKHTLCEAKSRKIKGKGNHAGHEWYLPTAEQAEFDK